MRVIPPEIVDFPINNSRAGTATYFDSSRVLRLAPTSLGYADYAGLNVTVGKRINFDPVGITNQGYMVEPSRTNLVINNDAVINTTRSISLLGGGGIFYTLSFYGTGSVKVEMSGLTTFTLTGNSNTTPVFTVDSAVSSGSSPCPAYRVSQVFNPSLVGTVVLTITGTVRFLQLELGNFPTSIIVTTGASVTRAADDLGYVLNDGRTSTSVGGYLSSTRATTTEFIAEYKVLPSFLQTNPSSYTDLASVHIAGTTITAGNKYVYAGWVYQALITTTFYSLPSRQLTTAQWQFIGADNPNAMFYSLSNEKTSISGGSNKFVFAITAPYAASSIALFGLEEVDTVTIVVNNRRGSIISTDISGNPTDLVVDFTPWITTQNEGFYDWELYAPIITVCIKGSNINRPVKIGKTVVGISKELGKTQYGASIGIIDYSTKTTDAFGNTTFVKRAYAKKMNARLLLDKSIFNVVTQTFFDLRATPVAWVASEDTAYSKGALIYGYYKDFSIDISYPTMNSCSLEVEGLI